MRRADWILSGIGLLAVASPVWAAVPPSVTGSGTPAPAAASAATAARPLRATGAPAAKAAAWESFINPAHTYSVQVPGRPWRWGRRPDGQPVDRQEERYGASAGPYIYLLSDRLTPKPLSTDTECRLALDMAEMMLEKTWHGKIVSSRPTSQGEYLGRALRLTHRGREMDIRMFVSKNRTLMAAVDGPAGGLEDPRAARFLKSFRALKAGATSAKRAPAPEARPANAASGGRPQGEPAGAPSPAVSPAGTATSPGSTAAASAPTAEAGHGAVSIRPCVVWKRMAPRDGLFSVRLPASAVTARAGFRTTFGRASLKGYTGQSEGERYEVGRIEAEALTGSDAQTLLAAVRDGYVSTLGGRVTDCHPVAVTGATGMEFRAELKDGRAVQARLLALGDQLVLASAITPLDRSYSETSARFLTSLRLKQ